MWISLQVCRIFEIHPFSFWSHHVQQEVKIIQDWLEPKKVKNIQSFLRFTNFYCWFIFNYSNNVILLIYLTQKDIS